MLPDDNDNGLMSNEIIGIVKIVRDEKIYMLYYGLFKRGNSLVYDLMLYNIYIPV